MAGAGVRADGGGHDGAAGLRLLSRSCITCFFASHWVV